MSTDYDMFLSGELLEAKNQLELAKQKLSDAVRLAQSKCEHKFVGFCEYKRLEYLASLKPIRLCLECRLEEEATSLYSNVDSMWSREHKLNPSPSRVYITMPRESLYKLRIR